MQDRARASATRAGTRPRGHDMAGVEAGYTRGRYARNAGCLDKAMAEAEKSGKAVEAERRRERLATELRANLKKRKEQARRRSPERQGGHNPQKEEGEA